MKQDLIEASYEDHLSLFSYFLMLRLVASGGHNSGDAELG